jgi:RNA polymerase sigma-70 factor (ECF subfamily)
LQPLRSTATFGSSLRPTSRRTPTPVTDPVHDARHADQPLMRSIAAGDERALATLFDRHGGMAYALALAILGERADAEEAVGDAFAQIWRTAGEFDASRGSLASWVATIVRSRALDLRRARARSGALVRGFGDDDGARTEEARLEDPGAPPDDEAESGELRARIGAALRTLPAPQREALELAYFGGLSQSEIAERLRQPLGTVKTRIRAAMAALRLVLAPMRERGAL